MLVLRDQLTGLLSCNISCVGTDASHRNYEKREPRLRRGISLSLVFKSCLTDLALSPRRLISPLHVTDFVCSYLAAARTCGGRGDAP